MSGVRYVGLMSGTSLDGVDAVLVEFTATAPILLVTHYLPFSPALRQELLALHTPGENELHRSQLVANQLAVLYAQSVHALLAQSPGPVRAIGCHGQTIRHCPEQGYTLQIGNAALLAELTGLTVIHDFRSRDIAAGGQGAPLVPAFHDRILRHPERARVIVNIGGISNLTLLLPGQPTAGFDCGPGNLLLDAWCQLHRQQPFDRNGDWAVQGMVLPDLLTRLYQEDFFHRPPPKSSGRDLFNMAWLTRHLEGSERPQDVQRTLLELTSRCIAEAIPQAAEVYLCGGGAHNGLLRASLQNRLPHCAVQTTEVLGVSPDYLEAIAFAWLAWQHQLGLAGNLPVVTGARQARILGACHPGHQGAG